MTDVNPLTPPLRHRGEDAVSPDRTVGSGSLAWAEMVLRGQEMPSDELRVVLASSDRHLVHRYLELHQERMEEWILAQRQALAKVERILAETATQRLAGRI
jgi:hypothetical protein